jgi:hypothetical protein
MMRESRRSRRKARFAYQTPATNKNKAIPLFLIGSLFCLLIAHFNFNNLYSLFIVGLLGFSFTAAFLLVMLVEHYLPPGWLLIAYGLAKELAVKVWQGLSSAYWQ